MKKAEKIVIALGILLLIVSFRYDVEILKFIEQWRRHSIDQFMLFLTNAGLYILTAALALVLLLNKKYELFVLVTLSALLSLETTYILKKTFQIARPYLDESAGISALAEASGYAFPSLHAAFCLSIIPFLHKIVKSRWVQWAVAAVLLIIVGSRIYIGVHYLSDILFGSIIGYLFARTVILVENRYQLFEWFIYHLKEKMELRRQVAHALTGIVIVVGLKFGYLNLTILGVILAVGGIVSFLSLRYKIPVIHQILRFFERPGDMRQFPGKGSFFLVLGAFASVLLFEEKIAYAAITVMAVGDALTTIIGSYFGKLKMPLNPSKHIEGTVLAVIISTIGAYTFVDFPKAFLGSAAGMLFELLTFRYFDRVIDDNLLIPLITGFVMTAIG